MKCKDNIFKEELLTQLSTILLEKVTGSSTSQEIIHILRNPKVHYRIHKCPPPVPVLRQLHLVRNIKPHFLKIHLNVSLPSAPMSSKWTLPLRFPHQNPLHTTLLPHSCYMPSPSLSSRIDQAKFLKMNARENQNNSNSKTWVLISP